MQQQPAWSYSSVFRHPVIFSWLVANVLGGLSAAAIVLASTTTGASNMAGMIVILALFAFATSIFPKIGGRKDIDIHAVPWAIGATLFMCAGFTLVLAASTALSCLPKTNFFGSFSWLDITLFECQSFGITAILTAVPFAVGCALALQASRSLFCTISSQG